MKDTNANDEKLSTENRKELKKLAFSLLRVDHAHYICCLKSATWLERVFDDWMFNEIIEKIESNMRREKGEKDNE